MSFRVRNTIQIFIIRECLAALIALFSLFPRAGKDVCIPVYACIYMCKYEYLSEYTYTCKYTSTYTRICRCTCVFPPQQKQLVSSRRQNGHFFLWSVQFNYLESPSCASLHPWQHGAAGLLI